ncbi:MAG: glycoside hydrolase family 3 C-terminal domain-containing protein, partial [Anaerolineaceae bacterium]|nr:glycoside hydrolase family 3 C-terminal domain-containing protein [Anaerolineaceae bacterium]
MNKTAGMNELLSRQSNLIKDDDGFTYRDLNKNGKLDIYEDPRQPIEARIEDLLSQMTLAEKAGMLFINGAVVNEDGSIDEKAGAPGSGRVAKTQMIEQQMNHFNLWEIPGAKAVAAWYNNLQKFAEETRLGIPVTIASDPRNHFSSTIFSMAATDFSQWCEALGFGALDDPELVRKFAQAAREEYLAIGIRVALHPQVDLATEPRWPRINGTFGEDAEISARLVKAYILGFQGAVLGPDSVACMSKHFPGGGPQKEGLDPHFEFQQGQIYPGGTFDYHLIPFEAAIEAKTASIMPYYGVPMDQTDENVAMAFNKTIITKLLREKYGFDGVICTDWGLITDSHVGTVTWPARAWGVEHLSEAERVLKAIDAGVDQFGGESRPDLLLALFEGGDLTEERIDQSARRLLRQKFQLGLFDNPFVDESRIPDVFGKPEVAAAGLDSQSRAMTLLKNNDHILPLIGQPKIFVKNIDTAITAEYAHVVNTPVEADFSIIRLETPWIPVDTQNEFARGFHHGDLDFKNEEKLEILSLLESSPTIVIIHLDRPAVIPEISAAAQALLADYGASDQAVLNIIFGRAQPEGKLPFELPSSMEAVRNQYADVPCDSENPLYPFGFGLSYT